MRPRPGASPRASAGVGATGRSLTWLQSLLADQVHTAAGALEARTAGDSATWTEVIVLAEAPPHRRHAFPALERSCWTQVQPDRTAIALDHRPVVLGEQHVCDVPLVRRGQTSSRSRTPSQALRTRSWSSPVGPRSARSDRRMSRGSRSPSATVHSVRLLAWSLR